MQHFLRSLIPPLQACGASQKVVAEIETASGNLEPFSALTMEAFAAFLGRAEEYDRTGIVPVVAKAAPKKSTSPRGKKADGPPYTAEDALRDVRDLYERSLGEDVSYAMIDAEIKKLDKATSKAAIDAVTSQFGLGKAKSKKAAIEEIRQKIVEYKKSHQRTQF